MIAAMERVSHLPELREAASEALPELRAQLAEAERMLQAAASGASSAQSGQPGATRSAGATRSD